jgi:hypothetical protein
MKMFCPLCTAEFRDGFKNCSDCNGRARFWRGTCQEKLDRILGALDAQQIPSYFKEIVNMSPRISIMGIPIGKQVSTFEYEVWIFRHDSKRAHKAAAQVLHAGEKPA